MDFNNLNRGNPAYNGDWVLHHKGHDGLYQKIYREAVNGLG
jgi:hypothetical protein